MGKFRRKGPNMPARRGALNPRVVRSYRVAGPGQLGALTYAVPIHALAVSADARARIDALTCRARRVLSLYVALLRFGTLGYFGTSVSHSILAAAVALCTHERCGRSTLELALCELIGGGLMEKAWFSWKGSRRVEFEPGAWRTNQIRVYVLTAEAIALFSRPRASVRSGRGGAPVSLPGSAAAVSAVSIHTQKTVLANRIDSSSKSLETTGDRSLSSLPCVSVESKAVCPDGHDTTTPQGSDLATVEHDTSTSAQSAQSAFDGRLAISTGASCAAPCRPARGARATRASAREALLCDLWGFLRFVPSSLADLCMSRAAFETSADFDGSVLRCVSWDHYLNHWRAWNRQERLFALRSALYPALRGAAFAATKKTKLPLRPGGTPVASCVRPGTFALSAGSAAGSCASVRPADLPKLDPGGAVYVGDPVLAATLRRAVLAAGEKMGDADRQKMKKLAELVTCGGPIDTK